MILGGGLSGMTAAYTLQQAGEDWWQLYEREGRLGGLARSTAVDGYLFDFGPHILFTIHAEIETLWAQSLRQPTHAAGDVRAPSQVLRPSADGCVLFLGVMSLVEILAFILLYLVK